MFCIVGCIVYAETKQHSEIFRYETQKLNTTSDSSEILAKLGSGCGDLAQFGHN